MAFCGECGASIEDGKAFCPECGHSTSGAYAQANDMGNSTDHTSDFTYEDISNNKAWALLGYIFTLPGALIGLIAGISSPYARFHATQALKLFLVWFLGSAILSLVALVVAYFSIDANGLQGFNVLSPIGIILAVYSIAIFILDIIGFFNVCFGQARDLPIVGRLAFLR